MVVVAVVTGRGPTINITTAARPAMRDEHGRAHVARTAKETHNFIMCEIATV